MNTKKGFTLVELLIVIAILAVLGVAVVLVLNPAELIRRSRDATRISDLATLNSAVAFYLTEATTPSLGTCAQGRVTFGTVNPGFATATVVTIADYTVAGSGWVSINFGSITGGSPLATLPRDPVNNATNYYAYACNGTLLRYEIDANMESAKYQNGGDSDVESTDGGLTADWYEVGNSLTL